MSEYEYGSPEWEKAWEKERQWYVKAAEKDAAFLREDLSNICEMLKKRDIVFVRMTYDGGGDSGDYHAPIVTTKDEKKFTVDLQWGTAGWRDEAEGDITLDEKFIRRTTHLVRSQANYREIQGITTEMKDTTLGEALYEVMYEVVDQKHGGWYNNEGGEGSVELNVADKELSVEHGDHYTQTYWDNYTIRAEEAPKAEE
jgi:hypothetical protein